VARKYMCQSDIKGKIVITCNELENEIYRLRAEEKKKQTLIHWLNKLINTADNLTSSRYYHNTSSLLCG
jgi:hypothetical protein